VGASAAAIALLSAVLYGAADFVGGLMSRRASTLSVVFLSQSAGALALMVILPLLPAATVRMPDLVWGATAGLAGGAGVALLYRALALGTMSVVAPTTAVCAVVIPVATAFARGERLAPLAVAGIALALVAIALVSRSAAAPAHAAARPAAALLLAIGSGVAIGTFYLSLARTSQDAGMWPLLAARGASVALFAAWGFTRGPRALLMPRALVPVAIGGGLLDMTANGLYLMATRLEALSIVVTLASLYPASTVLLARVVLHERLSRMQAAGVVTCLVAIVLLVSG
jgi:drug/metabolite transporter (DMT)-like permease